MNNTRIFNYLHNPLLLLFALVISFQALGQTDDFRSIRTEVYFDETLRDWDGFGFNYVETAQTMNYEEDPQEYGGFSLLDEKGGKEIIGLILGKDGSLTYEVPSRSVTTFFGIK